MKRESGIRNMTAGSPLRHILVFTLPLLAGNFLQQFYNMVDSWVVGNFVSDAALAAVGVGFPVIFLFTSLFSGIATGGTVVIAQAFGAGKPDRIMGTLKLAAMYAVTIMLIGLAVVQLIPDKLLMIFSASDTMLSIGIPALRTISLSFLFAGFSIVCSSMFQALGHGMLSLWISVFRQLVVLLPVAFVFAKLGGLHVVWFAFPIAEVFAIIFSAVCLGYVYRKEILPLKARQEK